MTPNYAAAIGCDDRIVSQSNEHLDGKSVLITGAGGSIGSVLAKEILTTARPARLMLLDNCEYNLYRLQEDLQLIANEAAVTTYLADVRHSSLMEALMQEAEPQFVYHAAALKHVPMLQVRHNALEAIRTNVLGTENVLHYACKAGAEQFVLVSTDKAVEPLSMMGLTKMYAENYCREYALDHGDIQVSIVRFGNVIGSSGSVLPFWHDQIKRGVPVTVTSKEMYRYFMTIQQAVSLILRFSGLTVTNGSPCTGLLEMGEPRNMYQIAGRMIHTFADPYHPIEVIGLRPGEKLEEKLVGEGEQSEPIADGLYSIYGQPLPKGYVGNANMLQALCEERQFEPALQLMLAITGVPNDIVMADGGG